MNWFFYKNSKRIFLLFISLGVAAELFSQQKSQDNFVITKRMITMEDGLPSRLVYDAIQDKDDFMWFATANGLCRYNGHSFKIYNTQNSALHSNIITALGIDAKNRLYIQSALNLGSVDAQFIIQVLELNTGRFIPLHQALPNIPFLTDQQINLIHDAIGNIFFLTDHRTKIWKYGTNEMFTLRLKLKNNLNGKLSFSYIPNYSIKSANECLLIRKHDNRQSYCVFPDTTIIFDDNKFISIAITEKKEFILYDVSSKVYVLMNSSGKKERISYTPSVDESKKTAPTLNNFDEHSQLFKSASNNYFLHADNQWINIYNSDDQKKYPSFGINNYFKDRTGNYWFCTEKGIYQVNFRMNQFEHYFSNNPNEQYINNAVRGIYVNQDSTGNKTVYAMVNYELLKRKDEEKIIPNIVATVLLKKNDLFYLSGNPLMAYNPVSGKVKSLSSFRNIGEVWSMADFSDSLILLGGTEGIIIYNTNAGYSMPIQFAHANTPIPKYVYRILKTIRRGWVAVAENGLYFINERGIVFDYYGLSQQLPDKQLPFTGIFDLYEDKEGIAWLAMNGKGLIRWNWNATHPMLPQHFKFFTIQNGLPDNILYRIEEDAASHLWISSYNGLVRFDKKNYSTKIFRTKDGLANVEFNRISSFKDDKGWMYFGGQNGIDCFDPIILNNETPKKMPPFRLVGLSKYSSLKDTIVDISSEQKLHQEIVMNIGDKFLSVSYSLLDYQERKNYYAYRIDGLDKDWNYVNEDVIRISGLPFGKLTLRIKAQMESGNWSEDEIVIPIQVLKPFYLENVFIVLATLTLALLTYFIYLCRIRKLKKDTFKLEQKVQQRTESLNIALSEKELLLTEIHHRVKNNLQVISGLLELRKSKIEDEKSLSAFNESQSGIMSIAMIHELLYQNENVGKLEFNFILSNIISNVAQLFGKQERKILFEIVPNNFMFDVNTAVTLGLIMNELLTNAYKYLPVNQTNKVIIDIKETGMLHYSLIFHDNGPGLPVDVDFEESATIGFSMIKSLAKQLQGTIVYEYEQGSKFVLSFTERV